MRRGSCCLALSEDCANYQTVSRFRVYSEVSFAVCIGRRARYARLFINRIKTSRNDLTTVIPKPNEPVEVALRRFRRAIQNNGLIAELRARTAYEKPTTERKRKKAAAVARLRKQIRRALPPRKLY